MTVFHSHYFCQGRIPGHLASRDGSARDAGQMGSIPGRPGQSGTGGNPSSLAVSAKRSERLIVCEKHTLFHDTTAVIARRNVSDNAMCAVVAGVGSMS